MITADQVLAVSNVFLNEGLENCSIHRDVAFGIKGVGAEGHDAWLIVRFREKDATEIELSFVNPHPQPDDALGVSIAVLADAQTWLEIGAGGTSSAIEAADQKKLYISGALPYFIRNVRSLVDLVVRHGTLLHRHNELAA